MTLEEGLELLSKYKEGIQKFLQVLPIQVDQMDKEKVDILTMTSKKRN